MAFSLESIRKETGFRAPRIIILGVEKIGKTTFACGSRVENGKVVETGLNAPIVIPMKGEEGADGLGVDQFPTCKTFSEMMDALGALYMEDHGYKTVVIDSASAANPMVMDDVCKEFSVNNIRKVPGFRTGEAAVQNRWRNVLEALDCLREQKNMASIIIGHVKIKKHKNPEGDDYDEYDLDVEMGEVSEMLKRWADVILFANTKVVIKKESGSGFTQEKKCGIDITGGQRFLFTQKRPAHPGGGRGVYGQLPYELPLDWSVFMNAIAEASK